MSEISKTREANAFDQLEAELIKHKPAHLPVKHRFTPGIYIREITMPAGTMLTSMTHKTEHPFVLSKGVVYVTTKEGREIMEAPYTGVTKAGTRRAIYVEQDAVWTTFHATDETDIEKICESLLEPYDNPLVSSNNQLACRYRESLPTK